MLRSFADFLDALQLIASNGDARVYAGNMVINGVVQQHQIVVTMDTLVVCLI
jgi:hypothetical protein